MEDIITEIKHWISERSSEAIFNQPASLADIQQLEICLNGKAPTELVKLLMCCNGEVENSTGLMSFTRLLPIDEIIERRQYLSIEDESDLIPLTDDFGGNYHCLNHQGEVIYRDHEVPEEAWFVAESLEAFFTDFLGDLRKGRYVISQEEDSVGLIELIDVFDMDDPDIYMQDREAVYKMYDEEGW